jgi:hypothetical protein
VTTQRYKSEAWSKLLALWHAYNQHLAWVIEAISEQELAKPRGVHSLDRIAMESSANGRTRDALAFW